MVSIPSRCRLYVTSHEKPTVTPTVLTELVIATDSYVESIFRFCNLQNVAGHSEAHDGSEE